MHRPGETQGPGALSSLERLVLGAALQGDGPELQILRDQLARATVLSRTHSGVGFMTRLAVPADLPAAASAPRLKPVFAAHPFLREQAEFLLQLREGRLAVLEAYCQDGTWPADETPFRVLG